MNQTTHDARAGFSERLVHSDVDMEATLRLRRYRRCVQVASATAGLIGLLVLAGWVFGFPGVTSILPTWPKMVPLTALGISFTALALLLLAPLIAGNAPALPHARQLAARICAALVLCAGAVGLITRLAGWNLRLDTLTLEPLALDGMSPVGSMSPATGLGLLLLGSALQLVYSWRWRHAYQLSALVVAMIGWVGFSRYAFGGEPLVPYASMAIHTSSMLLLLGASTLALRSDFGLMGLLVSRNAGGASLRMLLPATVIVPLAAGVLIVALVGQSRQTTTVSLFALSIVVVLLMAVWFSATLLERADLERQAVQHALNSSEEHMRLIIESALDAVISIDRTGLVTEWNAQAEAVFGWTRGEATGRMLDELIIPVHKQAAHRGGMQHYLQTGVGNILNQRVESSALRRNREEFPVELAVIPIRTGEHITFSAFVRDITERKAALQALQASETSLRMLAESLPHLVWTCRPDGWCDYVNRQWSQYTGLPDAEQLGFAWAERLHPDDSAYVQREWTAATVRGDSFDIEFRLRRFDGVYRWFKTRAVPLRDAAGSIVKWFGSNTDFDDSKRAEERLRAQLERLHLLGTTTRAIGERQDLHSIFQVVLRNLEERLPIDFGCICLHETAAPLLTVSCVGAQSQPLAAELGLSEQARIYIDQHALARCVAGEQVHEPDTTATGSPFCTRLARAGLSSVVFAPLSVESKVFGVLLVARRSSQAFSSSECEFLWQLSEHVALAANQAKLYGALQRAYEDMRQSQQATAQQERLRALGQMASGIAHDINNALSPAALYVQLMWERDASLSERSRGYLEVVKRAIEGVSNTVARMRSFAQPREPEMQLLPVDLNDILAQVVELTRARWGDMAQERGITNQLQMELEPDLPEIAGAEDEIRDALTNLVFNAVDAMPSGGTLGLRTRSVRAASEVVVEVSDTGVGMDEEERNRCLEPFYTTKGERGSGLGLAMVYGMVQRHGAQIQIDSERGCGTVIRLIFTSASVPEVAELPAQQAPATGLRILLIDDDPLILESLTKTLALDGHEPVAVDGGKAGIDSFVAAEQSGEHFKVVITDLGMPHVDGRKVAAAIKSVAPRTPVIMLTGWGHSLQADQHQIEGVDRILSKPPRLKEIRSVLAELTGDRVHAPASPQTLALAAQLGGEPARGT